MLCEKCSNIHFTPAEDWEVMRREPDRRSSMEDFWTSHYLYYFHHGSKQELESCAELHGCHFCVMLVKRLEEMKGMSIWKKGSDIARCSKGEVVLSHVVDEENMEHAIASEKQHWTIEVYVGEESCHFESFVECPEPVAKMLQALTVCDENGLARPHLSQNRAAPVDDKEDDGDLERLTPTRSPWLYSARLDISNFSPASIQLTSTWMQNCLQNHVPCHNEQEGSALPSRIINVSDPQHPFLDDGNDREAQYITLSYKWGNDSRFATTTEKLRGYKQGIPLDGMPQTFKEAIYVTVKLGYRFLWIDALCIVQDSFEELEREIGSMDTIYQMSVLTIFAAAGEDANAGLSVSRDPRWVRPCRLDIQTTWNGKTYKGFKYMTIRRFKLPMPLFRRGWVLQEQVLSTRGLIFDNRGVTWRCLGGHSTESHPAYLGRIDTPQQIGGSNDRFRESCDSFDSFRIWLKGGAPTRGDFYSEKENYFEENSFKKSNPFDQWYALVNNYSLRQLTNAMDVLPALTGLANAMSKAYGCNYNTGLWNEDLQNGLTWYVSRKDDMIALSNMYVGTRPQLPSWSWASRWGMGISFIKQDRTNLVGQDGIASVSDPGQQSIPASNCSKDIRENHLVLTGLLKQANVASMLHRQSSGTIGIENDAWLYTPWRGKIKDTVSKETIGQIALDCDPDMVPVAAIYCLLCTTQSHPLLDEWQLTCLALVRIDGSMRDFRRVGLAVITRGDWFSKLGDREGLNEDYSSGPYSRDSGLRKTIRVC